MEEYKRKDDTFDEIHAHLDPKETKGKDWFILMLKKCYELKRREKYHQEPAWAKAVDSITDEIEIAQRLFNRGNPPTPKRENELAGLLATLERVSTSNIK